MELNWSTFLLEILNFLVLVWLLKHFLYRPVMNALEKRRQAIADSIEEANQHHQQALNLEQQYQDRLDKWQQEQQQAKDALQEELSKERDKQLKLLEQLLSSEKQKATVIREGEEARMLEHQQQQIHQQAVKFASKLLSSIAGPELENRLIEVSLQQLEQLEATTRKQLQVACKNNESEVVVETVYPVQGEQASKIETTLNELCGSNMQFNYSNEASLLAGIRIHINAWVIGFNLQDELSGFAELNHDQFIN